MKQVTIISAIAICLAARIAQSQYQTAPAYGNGYQKKSAPQNYANKNNQQQKSLKYGGYDGQLSSDAMNKMGFEAAADDSSKIAGAYGGQSSVDAMNKMRYGAAASSSNKMNGAYRGRSFGDTMSKIEYGAASDDSSKIAGAHGGQSSGDAINKMGYEAATSSSIKMTGAYSGRSFGDTMNKMGYRDTSSSSNKMNDAYRGRSFGDTMSKMGYRAAADYGSQSVGAYGGQLSGDAMNKMGYGAAAGGSSQGIGYGNKQYEEPQHPPMPFAWGYDLNDGYGSTQFHKETGDEYGKRTGSYGYKDAHGVHRQVNYVADENGFRATIKTNEPGTANENPADIIINMDEPTASFAGNKMRIGNGDYETSSGQYGLRKA